MEKAKEEDAEDSTELQNKANSTKIKLSNKLKAGKTVTIQNEHRKIRWGLDAAKGIESQAEPDVFLISIFLLIVPDIAPSN